MNYENRATNCTSIHSLEIRIEQTHQNLSCDIHSSLNTHYHCQLWANKPRAHAERVLEQLGFNN
uniref:Uncharacterized protein n=1 Tax=Solanum lycopersicum TaxID=4081 RepID=A0A3Q7EUB3_SOLLC